MSTTQQPQQFGPPQYPPPSYPPPAYPPQPYRRSGPPSTDTKRATWALVLAFIPGGIPWIISFGLAVQTLSGIRRGERVGGKKRSIAALVVIACWILLIAVGFALADSVDRDGNGQITSAGTISVLDVKEGDCINVGAAEKIMTVEATPCADPHQWEAFGAFALPDGEFPGNGVVQRAGDMGCLERAREFLGTTPRRAGVLVLPLTPMEQGWKTLDDHSVTCLVGYGGDRRAVGSLADVGPRTGSGDGAITT